MDFRTIVILALQVSIISTVFGFGLKATPDDLLYVVRRPRLLMRSLVAMFVCMPLVALTLLRIFDFPHAVNVTLVALSISPVPPILPRKQVRSGGSSSFGLGLMAVLSTVAIGIVPAALGGLAWLSGRTLALPPGEIAALMLKATLAPLFAGVALRRFAPAIANRVEPVTLLAAKWLMPVAIVVVLAGAALPMWEIVGSGTLLAMTIFTLSGIAIGHVLGGPEREHSTVLALSTSCRHPALALAILATNFPDQRSAPLILLYLLVSGIVGFPYVMWQRHQATRAAHAV